jgi:hypothetical protein
LGFPRNSSPRALNDKPTRGSGEKIELPKLLQSVRPTPSGYFFIVFAVRPFRLTIIKFRSHFQPLWLDMKGSWGSYPRSTSWSATTTTLGTTRGVPMLPNILERGGHRASGTRSSVGTRALSPAPVPVFMAKLELALSLSTGVRAHAPLPTSCSRCPMPIAFEYVGEHWYPPSCAERCGRRLPGR